MAVTKRPASLQALWLFIAIIRDCNWHNWFYRGCFGASAIIKGCGSVDLCGKGLIIALHNKHGPIALCGKGLIIIPSPVAILGKGFVVTLFGKRLVVALFGKHGIFLCTWYTCPRQCTHHFQHTCFTCLWQHTRLWQCTRHLQCTCRTQPQRICAAGHCMAQYGPCCILRTTTWTFIIALESCLSFPCICCFIAIAPCNMKIKEWLLHWWCCHCCITINFSAGALCLCNHWCGWSALIKKVGCYLCLHTPLLQSTIVIAPCNTTGKIIFSLLLLAIQRRLLKTDHGINNAVVIAIDFIASACVLKIWLVVAWRNLALLYCNQPLLLFLLTIQCKKYTDFHHPCNWQHIQYLIVAWDVSSSSLQILASGNVQIIYCCCLLPHNIWRENCSCRYFLQWTSKKLIALLLMW